MLARSFAKRERESRVRKKDIEQMCEEGEKRMKVMRRKTQEVVEERIELK